jgi:hypothetical protein
VFDERRWDPKATSLLSPSYWPRHSGFRRSHHSSGSLLLGFFANNRSGSAYEPTACELTSTQEIGGPVGVEPEKDGDSFPGPIVRARNTLRAAFIYSHLFVRAAGTVGPVDLEKKERGLP